MKHVLIVVDYQNDFVTGSLAFEKAKRLNTDIASLMKKYAKDEDGEIFCTFDTHGENYLDTQEGKKLPVEHCIKDTHGWQLYDEVAMTEIMYPMKCTRVYKETFGSIKLAKKLEELNKRDTISDITLVGVVTNMCVISNAIIAKAACPEAEIIVKSSLVSGPDEELHNKALDVMKSMQITVE